MNSKTRETLLGSSEHLCPPNAGCGTHATFCQLERMICEATKPHVMTLGTKPTEFCRQTGWHSAC